MTPKRRLSSSTTKTIVINDIYAETFIAHYAALSQFLSAHDVPSPCRWISDSVYGCEMKYVDQLEKGVQLTVFLPWLKMRLTAAHSESPERDELVSMMTAFRNANQNRTFLSVPDNTSSNKKRKRDLELIAEEPASKRAKMDNYDVLTR